jgi:CHAT domain-containing protein
VTGELAFLPLHAAGIYGSKDPSDDIKLSDFAVSSYTTTLSALITDSGRQTKCDPKLRQKVLIVTQPATPGFTLLPGTEEEAKVIQKYTSPEDSRHLTHDQATVDTVKNEMCKHGIVHLACHGIQDSTNPLDSAFALYDGKLKFHDLMSLSLDNAELAFLSACQTAAGDEKLPEEVVHLAAGMLVVGYPSVIATMWSIGDKDAPIVADKVYESLLGRHDEPMTRNSTQSAAYALHTAIKHLKKEVGEMNFVKWVPFVHYGV